MKSQKSLNVMVERAGVSDYPEILKVQHDGFLSEARAHNKYNIHALVQTLEELTDECRNKVVLKAVVDGKIVGTIRGNEFEGGAFLNKLAVFEEYRGLGIGTRLLEQIEASFPHASKFSLGTAANSIWNIKMYERLGYEIVKRQVFEDGSDGVIMEKLITSNK